MINFNKYRIDDDVLSAAYEGLDMQAKGWIKKTIATLYGFYNKACPVQQQIVASKMESLSVTLSLAPQTGCVVLYDESYSAFTRALAAVCPAFYAGVENIYAIGVQGYAHNDLKFHFNSSELLNNLGQNDFPQIASNFNLLAAWELAGVEDIFSVPEVELVNLLSKSFARNKRQSFCVLVLGQPEWSLAIVELCRQFGFKFWQEPVLQAGVIVNSKDNNLVRMVKALHSDLTVKSVKSLKSDKFPVLISNNCETVSWESKSSFSLCLDEAQAGCWVWPELGLDFFMTHAACITDNN